MSKAQVNENEGMIKTVKFIADINLGYGLFYEKKRSEKIEITRSISHETKNLKEQHIITGRIYMHFNLKSIY